MLCTTRSASAVPSYKRWAAELLVSAVSSNRSVISTSNLQAVMPSLGRPIEAHFDLVACRDAGNIDAPFGHRLKVIGDGVDAVSKPGGGSITAIVPD